MAYEMVADFRSFFLGSALGVLERACLASFVARGHSFTLYVYEPIAVPAGVALADAARIIPIAERESFFAIAPGRISQFSNGVRYHLLKEFGGWWVDTDVLCLSDTVPSDELVLGWEGSDSVGTAVMKFPAQHPLISDALAFWVANQQEAAWSYTGPRLITRLVHEYGLAGRVAPLGSIYPISWRDLLAPFDPCRRDEVEFRTNGRPFLHLWNTPLSSSGLQRNLFPPRGSFLRTAIDHYLAEETRDITDDPFVSRILSAYMGMKLAANECRAHADRLTEEADALLRTQMQLSNELDSIKARQNALLSSRAMQLLRFLRLAPLE